MESITYSEFEKVFRSSKRAWHLEAKDTYNVAGEDEHFGKFLKGEPDDYEWMAGWFDFIREVTAAGVAVQRLRIVSEPHAAYTKWGFEIAPLSADAGEDIRYLPRHRLADISPPEEDCWLFDDDKLILSVFSDDGRTGGFARETDADLIGQYRTVRDRLWPLATRFGKYVTT